MKSFQVIMCVAIVLCCCGMASGQDQPTQPDQQPQQYAQPQYAPQFMLPQVASGPAPVWVIQKRWLGLGRYKAKPGWLNTGVLAAPMAVQAAPLVMQAAPPVITQNVLVPQTVTRQVMVPQTITEQVMVPMQVQRVPQPVITWSPSVQWRY